MMSCGVFVAQRRETTEADRGGVPMAAARHARQQ